MKDLGRSFCFFSIQLIFLWKATFSRDRVSQAAPHWISFSSIVLSSQYKIEKCNIGSFQILQNMDVFFRSNLKLQFSSAQRQFYLFLCVSLQVIFKDISCQPSISQSLPHLILLPHQFTAALLPVVIVQNVWLCQLFLRYLWEKRLIL